MRIPRWGSGIYTNSHSYKATTNNEDTLSTARRSAVGAQRGDCLKIREKAKVVVRLGLPFVLGTLTPTLSQREKEPFGAILRSPLPSGEGQGEGIRATILPVP